jgi:hypothetical protein
VSQSKFAVLNIMSSKIFGELIRFFSKVLNPFKIQTIFKLEFVLKFIIQNSERFGSWSNNQYINFGPNRVVRVPQCTTQLCPKLVRVLAIATHRTRSGFGVRAK